MDCSSFDEDIGSARSFERVNYSGRYSRAEIAPFSVCPGKIRPFVSPQNRSLPDFPPPFGDDFRTTGGGEHLTVIREFLSVETVSGQKNRPRPFFLFSLFQSFMTGFFVLNPFVAELQGFTASYPAEQRPERNRHSPAERVCFA